MQVKSNPVPLPKLKEGVRQTGGILTLANQSVLVGRGSQPQNFVTFWCVSHWESIVFCNFYTYLQKVLDKINCSCFKNEFMYMTFLFFVIFSLCFGCNIPNRRFITKTPQSTASPGASNKLLSEKTLKQAYKGEASKNSVLFSRCTAYLAELQKTTPIEKPDLECKKINQSLLEIETSIFSSLAVTFSALLEKNIFDQSINVISSIEPKVKALFNDSSFRSMDSRDLEFIIQIITLKMEKRAYSEAKKILNRQFLSDQNQFKVALDHLESEVDHSINAFQSSPGKGMLFDNQRAHVRFEENIENRVIEALKSKYSRSELSLLEKEEFNTPDEESYAFQSTGEEDFLNQLKALYNDIWLANPFHEQGILAKDCAISSVKISDKALLDGNTLEAKTAFKAGELLKDIVLGELFITEIPRFIYEYCVGKNLLTGESITTTNEDQISQLSSMFIRTFPDFLKEKDTKTIKATLAGIRNDTLKGGFSPLPFGGGQVILSDTNRNQQPLKEEEKP